MRRYETIIIIHPNTPEDGISTVLEKTESIITANDGQIVKIDKWGMKRLAYLIRKEQQGYYVYLEYAGTPEAVKEIERIYRIDDRVLKYMTIKTQEEYAPSEADKQEAAPETAETTSETTSQQQEESSEEKPAEETPVE